VSGLGVGSDDGEAIFGVSEAQGGQSRARDGEKQAAMHGGRERGHE
jgi:hypothetical protein